MMGLFKRRERDPNEWRRCRSAWRNGHGDVIRNGVHVIDAQLPDGYDPPSASLDPIASDFLHGNPAP